MSFTTLSRPLEITREVRFGAGSPIIDFFGTIVGAIG